jgi:quercetin dioxygenase-like cupin family protein
MQPIILHPGEGHARLWGQGSTITTKLTAADTGGALGLTVLHAASRERAPWHIHTREDEIFLVICGEVFTAVGDESAVLTDGGVLFLPRGIPHRYEVRGDRAEIYILTVPGGFERFFLTAGYPVGPAAKVGEQWSVSRTKGIAAQLDLGMQWLE